MGISDFGWQLIKMQIYSPINLKFMNFQSDTPPPPFAKNFIGKPQNLATLFTRWRLQGDNNQDQIV